MNAADLSENPRGSSPADGRTEPENAAPSATTPGLRLILASLQTQAREAAALAAAAAETLARPLLELEPTHDGFADIARRTVPRWHFAMLNDAERNSALAGALAAVLPAGGTVLDIGAGTGLLAMGAVRAGASHVYTCEENPLLAEIARQIIAEHGMADRITVIGRRSTALRAGPGGDLPAPADALVSEIVDCGLIGEGLLPSVRHARSELLRPGGAMMPVSARIVGRLISSPSAVALNRATEAAGFDVSLMNIAATRGHFPLRLATWPHRLLSAPAELARFDFAADPLTPGGNRVTMTCTETGHAHGLAAWFEMDLGGGTVLSNSPDHPSSHWMQAFVAFDKPVPVSAGAALDVEVRWSDLHLTAS